MTKSKNEGAGHPAKDVTGAEANQDLFATCGEEVQALKPEADIFADVGSFAVDPGEAIPSERILTSLRVRRPKEEEWVRAHPTLRTRLNVVTDKEVGATYLIHNSVLAEVSELVTVRPVILALATTLTGNPFAWPAPIPGDHRINPWHSSGLQALERATTEWIRMRADMAAGEYVLRRRIAEDGTVPVWPAEVTDIPSMLRLAFGGRGDGELIADPNHRVLRKLRGEV